MLSRAPVGVAVGPATEDAAVVAAKTVLRAIRYALSLAG